MEVWQEHLVRADGYLGLEMYDQAAMELARMTDEDRIRPEVVGFCVFLHSGARRWAEAADAAREMTGRQPEEVQWWISHAYAVRRARCIEEAEQILLEARSRHPGEAMVWYNLACYAAVTGRRAEALELIGEALRREPACRAMALEDQDLQTIWKEIAVLE